MKKEEWMGNGHCLFHVVNLPMGDLKKLKVVKRTHASTTSRERYSLHCNTAAAKPNIKYCHLPWDVCIYWDRDNRILWSLDQIPHVHQVINVWDTSDHGIEEYNICGIPLNPYHGYCEGWSECTPQHATVFMDITVKDAIATQTVAFDKGACTETEQQQ